MDAKTLKNLKRLHQAVREHLAQLKSWYYRKFRVLSSEITEDEQEEIDATFAELAAQREREDRELEQHWLAETCARCLHPRDKHSQWGLSYCQDCSEVTCDCFVDETEYTQKLKTVSETQKQRAAFEQELEDQSWDEYYDDSDDESDYIDERRYQWGEDFTLHFYHPIWGQTGLSMLEGEWLQAFKEMREQRTLPDDVIDQIEREFEESRDEWYQQFEEDDEDRDDSLE